jgi:hypothetical protein
MHSRENRMFRSLLHWLVPVAFLSGMGNAQAQAVPRTAAHPDPLNALAVVPTVVHSSAFAAYRRQAEATPIAWKDANDTVTRIGGWRAYAREAAKPSPAAPAPVASGSQP